MPGRSNQGLQISAAMPDPQSIFGGDGLGVWAIDCGIDWVRGRPFKMSPLTTFLQMIHINLPHLWAGVGAGGQPTSCRTAWPHGGVLGKIHALNGQNNVFFHTAHSSSFKYNSIYKLVGFAVLTELLFSLIL